MALTFEETTVDGRDDTILDNTAFALLSGIADYLDIRTDFDDTDEYFNSILTQSFMLRQNYPNPFNPATRIEYSISETMHVKLIVYDLLGRETAVLVEEYLSPGFHSAVFDASELPSGIYHAHLLAGTGRKVIKMMLVK